jgi:hypothetical protein
MATLVYRVTSVLMEQSADGMKTIIVATGEVVSSGWRNARLELREGELSPDGILDLDFLADAPNGVTLQVIQPVAAQFDWDNSQGRLRGVKIHARTDPSGAGDILIEVPRADYEFPRWQPRRWPPTDLIGEGWPSWPHPFPSKSFYGESGPAARETPDLQRDNLFPNDLGPFPPRPGRRR